VVVINIPVEIIGDEVLLERLESYGTVWFIMFVLVDVLIL